MADRTIQTFGTESLMDTLAAVNYALQGQFMFTVATIQLQHPEQTAISIDWLLPATTSHTTRRGTRWKPLPTLASSEPFDIMNGSTLNTRESNKTTTNSGRRPRLPRLGWRDLLTLRALKLILDAHSWGP